jgi:hypothetical protein
MIRDSAATASFGSEIGGISNSIARSVRLGTNRSTHRRSVVMSPALERGR